VIGTDNKPIVFYNTTVNIQDWNNNVSEIILCGADGSTIDNLTMDYTDVENNKFLIVATQNSNISNSVFIDVWRGIYSLHSNSNTFTNITTNSNAQGIYIQYSDSNTFTNITANSNSQGIHIQYSDSNTFTNITANSNTDGFYLSSSALNTINNSKIESNTNTGIYLSSSDSGGPNNIYNNLLNNTNNIGFGSTIYPNNWNTTKQTGTRIYSSGTEIGGNYYTNSTGNGYSDTCPDSEPDGFCDDAYNATNGVACTPEVDCGINADYLPMSDKYVSSEITISTCTNMTQAGKTYVLDTDILNSDIPYCMNISANNITFDCQGHTIQGNDAAYYGIYVKRDSPGETTNITIRNCNVSDWDTANIYLNYADHNNLTNITSTASPDNGIYSSYSNSNIFTNITTNSNSRGIYLQYSDSNTFTNITANSNSWHGINSYYSDSNTFENGYVLNNLLFDIYYLTTRAAFDCNAEFTDVTGTDNKPIVFYNTTVNIQDWNNNASEIILCGADDSTIDNLTIDHTDVENNGLLIVATQNANITNSVFTDLEYAIYSYYSDSNTFVNILINSNTRGLFQFYSDSNIFTNITANSNQYGVYFYYSALNTINNSKIESNTNYGIYLANSDSGGPNNIYNNFLNNTNNIGFSGTIYPNNWNTTKQSGTRIYSSGTEIGGNYYTNSTGNGYSDTCPDSEPDGFCDDAYNATNGVACTPEVDCGINADYLPLAIDTTPPAITIQSPENITYNTQSIWFNVTLNEPGDWCAYSLDNAANITMTNSSGNWNTTSPSPATTPSAT